MRAAFPCRRRGGAVVCIIRWGVCFCIQPFFFFFPSARPRLPRSYSMHATPLSPTLISPSCLLCLSQSLTPDPAGTRRALDISHPNRLYSLSHLPVHSSSFPFSSPSVLVRDGRPSLWPTSPTRARGRRAGRGGHGARV